MNALQKLLCLWKRWRLRKAQEKYAMWKARHEEEMRQLRDGGWSYQGNPYNRHAAIRDAGKAAKYMERVERAKE